MVLAARVGEVVDGPAAGLWDNWKCSKIVGDSGGLSLSSLRHACWEELVFVSEERWDGL